jgi:hypothetical protein
VRKLKLRSRREETRTPPISRHPGDGAAFTPTS